MFQYGGIKSDDSWEWLNNNRSNKDKHPGHFHARRLKTLIPWNFKFPSTFQIPCSILGAPGHRESKVKNC